MKQYFTTRLLLIPAAIASRCLGVAVLIGVVGAGGSAWAGACYDIGK